MRKRTHRGSQTKKGRHDCGSCLPCWRGRLKSIFGIDRTGAEESPNRPFDRRRFCAVQAFSRKRKPWRRANSLCPSIQIPKGEAGLWPAEPKKKDTTYVVSFFLVRAVGLEPTRIAPQEPKSCTSTNSAMPAEMTALTSYQPFPKKSNGPENMILVYICEYTLKIFVFVEIYSGIFQTYADVYA